MDFSRLLESLQKRIPWPVMKQILKSFNIERGRGWADTYKKISASYEALPDIKSKKAYYNKLLGAYKDHLFAGEKSLRLYGVDQDSLALFIKALNDYTVPKSVYKDSYPLPLLDADLLKQGESSELVDVSVDGGIYSLTFCTKRFVREKFEIDLENNADVGKYFSGFTSVYGVKEHTVQFFDILAVDSNSNIVEIRLDVGNSISPDERLNAFREMKKVFASFATDELGVNCTLHEMHNLFPVIDKLYRSTDGRVCELAFTTEEGSIKHEKMRRRNLCLRAETYHKAGTTAVKGQISAYRVAATWEHTTLSTRVTSPELLLPGSARMLSSASPHLSEAIITRCSNLEDYFFVRNKLTDFLSAQVDVTN